MKAKLKVIKNWEFEEFELTGTSFKYSPTGCKGMVAPVSYTHLTLPTICSV